MIRKAYIYVLNMKYNMSSKIRNENGMEMLQSILLVALAVGIGTLLFTVFGGQNGLVKQMLDNLSSKFQSWFN